MTGAASDWWESFFDDAFADLMITAPPTEEELAFLESLGAREGARVFDQCCGRGRVSLALAERGCETIGVDQARGYVDAARERARSLGHEERARFVCGDAFEFVPSEPCSVALNWHTSFGYAEDDARNREMLARAHDALEPGGVMLLDYGNVASVFADFSPAWTMRLETPDGELLVVRESEIDLNRGMLRQTWTFLPPGGGPHVRRGDTRLYLARELEEMMRSVGFEDIAVYGDRAGAPLELRSPRCVLVGRRRS